MRILAVEDDPAIGKALQQGFREAGHECQWEKTAAKARPLLNEQQFEVAVIDVMLPDGSGLDLITEMRQQGILTPAILLTARGAIDDRVRGLEVGADDYVVKPFAFAELSARVDAVCRRATTRPAPVLESAGVVLSLTTRRVRRGERDIDLSPTEFSLLEILMRYTGQVVTRKMLCEHLWDTDWDGISNVLEVQINRLRGKLDRGGKEPLIHTVRGRGYVFRSA